MIAKRPGAQFVCRIPRGEKGIALAMIGNQLYVATGKKVYVLRGRLLIPLKIPHA